MNCSKKCGCDFNIKTVGNCDVSKIIINGKDKTHLNWTEISIPEVLCIPEKKPDIEDIDQVYANVILDNIKLIETPFAYKKHILFSFYNSVINIDDDLPGLFTALSNAITAIITPVLDTTLLGALKTLKKALNSLTTIPGVSQVVEFLDKTINLVQDLITNINTLLLSVSNSIDNLILAIKTDPLPADIVCEVIKSIIYTLNTLNELINSLVKTLTDIVTSLDDFVKQINNPLLTTPVEIATTAINAIINTTLPPLINTATGAIESILIILLEIDCENVYAFEIIENAEGTCLTGRKLIVEGTLNQKIVYTAEVADQSVHSAHFEVPFIAFIIPYAKFEGVDYKEGIEVYDIITKSSRFINGYNFNLDDEIKVDLYEEFTVDKCIEDIYIYALDKRKIFKNITLFLKSKPISVCNE